MSKQVINLWNCDDCNKELSKDNVFNIRYHIYKPHAVGYIKEMEKEVCWHCMQNYIKIFNEIK